MDAVSSAEEQRSRPSLRSFWQFAEKDKKGFFVDNGLLYHRETLWGQILKQLCLPDLRIPVVLEMGHDAPYEGYMASKSIRQRIRMSFWFADVENRVPILPIPRGDEFPFSLLVTDCIGPIVPRGDSVSIQPKYNYALAVIDLISRWPMACPLRSSVQAVCDILLQIFMTFSVLRVKSSDCRINFMSNRTQFFLEYLGCSTRFHTPGHPEVSGVVDRGNQGLVGVICKLVEEHPQEWCGLLLFVWWSLRKGSSSAVCIGPWIFIYVFCPLVSHIDPGGTRASRLAQSGDAFFGRMIDSGKDAPCLSRGSLGRENRFPEYKKGVKRHNSFLSYFMTFLMICILIRSIGAIARQISLGKFLFLGIQGSRRSRRRSDSFINLGIHSASKGGKLNWPTSRVLISSFGGDVCQGSDILKFCL